MTTRPLPEVIERGKMALSDPMKVERLRAALTDLLTDLEDRARWMTFRPSEDGQRVPCGNGVYIRARQVLKETE